MHHDGIVCWDFSGMGPVSESPNGFAEGLRRGGRELWLPLALSQLRLQGMLRQAQWAGSRPCKRGAAVLKAPFSSPSTSIAVQGHAPRMTKTAAFFFFSEHGESLLAFYQERLSAKHPQALLALLIWWC